MNKKSIDYKEWLLSELQNDSKAREYLHAALLDEDPRVFFVALKDVLSVQNYSSK
jgi:hypothetical protein